MNGAIWMHSCPFYQLYTCTQQAMTCPFEYILNLTDEGSPSKNWLISKKLRDNLASRTAPQVLDEQYAYYYLLILALHSTSNILFFKLKKRDIECTIGWKQIRQWNIPVKRKFNRFSHQEKEETTGGMQLQQLKQDNTFAGQNVKWSANSGCSLHACSVTAISLISSYSIIHHGSN